MRGSGRDRGGSVAWRHAGTAGRVAFVLGVPGMIVGSIGFIVTAVLGDIDVTFVIPMAVGAVVTSSLVLLGQIRSQEREATKRPAG